MCKAIHPFILQVLLTSYLFIMTWTCSLLTHSIWKTVSSTGTCFNQSVKRHKCARCGAHINIHTHAIIFTATDIHTKGGKGNLEANRDWSFYSDICSVPETDGEPIRPPGASATPRLLCHPAAPPLNLHPGTHERWHLANVTLSLPWKIIYVFITVRLACSR